MNGVIVILLGSAQISRLVLANDTIYDRSWASNLNGVFNVKSDNLRVRNSCPRKHLSGIVKS